jgi:hypothetical protein
MMVASQLGKAVAGMGSARDGSRLGREIGEGCSRRGKLVFLQNGKSLAARVMARGLSRTLAPRSGLCRARANGTQATMMAGDLWAVSVVTFVALVTT